MRLFDTQVELPTDFWNRPIPRRVIQMIPAERTARAPRLQTSHASKRESGLPVLLTYPEVCERIRIGMTTLKELVGAGELEVQPIRGKRLIPEDSVVDYLARERARHG